MLAMFEPTTLPSDRTGRVAAADHVADADRELGCARAERDDREADHHARHAGPGGKSGCATTAPPRPTTSATIPTTRRMRVSRGHDDAGGYCRLAVLRPLRRGPPRSTRGHRGRLRQRASTRPRTSTPNSRAADRAPAGAIGENLVQFRADENTRQAQPEPRHREECSAGRPDDSLPRRRRGRRSPNPIDTMSQPIAVKTARQGGRISTAYGGGARRGTAWQPTR